MPKSGAFNRNGTQQERIGTNPEDMCKPGKNLCWRMFGLSFIIGNHAPRDLNARR
jgi:hypothetical protein